MNYVSVLNKADFSELERFEGMVSLAEKKKKKYKFVLASTLPLLMEFSRKKELVVSNILAASDSVLTEDIRSNLDKASKNIESLNATLDMLFFDIYTHKKKGLSELDTLLFSEVYHLLLTVCDNFVYVFQDKDNSFILNAIKSNPLVGLNKCVSYVNAMLDREHVYNYKDRVFLSDLTSIFDLEIILSTLVGNPNHVRVAHHPVSSESYDKALKVAEDIVLHVNKLNGKLKGVDFDTVTDRNIFQLWGLTQSRKNLKQLGQTYQDSK